MANSKGRPRKFNSDAERQKAHRKRRDGHVLEAERYTLAIATLAGAIMQATFSQDSDKSAIAKSVYSEDYGEMLKKLARHFSQ